MTCRPKTVVLRSLLSRKEVWLFLVLNSRLSYFLSSLFLTWLWFLSWKAWCTAKEYCLFLFGGKSHERKNKHYHIILLIDSCLFVVQENIKFSLSLKRGFDESHVLLLMLMSSSLVVLVDVSQSFLFNYVKIMLNNIADLEVSLPWFLQSSYELTHLRNNNKRTDLKTKGSGSFLLAPFTRQELEVVFADTDSISSLTISAKEEATQKLEGSSGERSHSNCIHDFLSSPNLTDEEAHKMLIDVRRGHTQSTWTNTTTIHGRGSWSEKRLSNSDCEPESDRSRRLLSSQNKPRGCRSSNDLEIPG